MRNAISTIAVVAVVLYGLSRVGSADPDRLESMVEIADQTRSGDDSIAGVDLYVKQKPHPLKKDYPELFATEAIVLTFSADWCAACRRQALELRGPSEQFNILRVKVEADNQKTRWSTLMDKLELGETIPVTIVVSKGEVTKTFYGYTPWSQIKPHAGKAKKNEKDETDHIDIGPIHIDWDDGVDIDFRRRKPRP